MIYLQERNGMRPAGGVCMSTSIITVSSKVERILLTIMVSSNLEESYWSLPHLAVCHYHRRFCLPCEIIFAFYNIEDNIDSTKDRQYRASALASLSETLNMNFENLQPAHPHQWTQTWISKTPHTLSTQLPWTLFPVAMVLRTEVLSTPSQIYNSLHPSW